MGLGLWIGRRVHSSRQFFVAGRQLGPGLLASTMLAANIGAGSTVGAAALGYRDGLSAWWWVGSAGLGSIVLARWIGPAIRALAVKHDLRPVGDFLEFRYGQTVRAVVAALLWVGTLAVLLTGFVVVIPLTLHTVGGWDPVLTATREIDGYWSFWRGGGSGWFYLAMLGPAFVVSPGLLQKVYAARSDKAVRIGVGLNAGVLLAFAAGPPLLGMIARATFPALPAHDLALPTLLMETLPPWLVHSVWPPSSRPK